MKTRKIWYVCLVLLLLLLTGCPPLDVEKRLDEHKKLCEDLNYEFEDAYWVVSEDGVNGTFYMTIKNSDEYSFSGIVIRHSKDSSTPTDPVNGEFLIAPGKQLLVSYSMNTSILRRDFRQDEETMWDIFDYMYFSLYFQTDKGRDLCHLRKAMKKTAIRIEYE